MVITMVIIVICLSMENKLGLKLTMVVLIFRLKICLVSISSKCSYTEPEGYLEKEICMIFQLIMGALQLMIYLTFTSI